jgi:hypothetical protein
MPQEINFSDGKLTAIQRNRISTYLRELLLVERKNAPEFKYENYTDVKSWVFNKRFSGYFDAHE